MTDPFAARRREAFQADHFPDWTRDAACRDKVTVAGNPWEAAFTDADKTYMPRGEYQWSEDLLDVMQVCATCPVQRTCLAYGFSGEEPVLLGVRLLGDEEAEMVGKSYLEEWLTPQAVGVYGGVPGPMRERFRMLPDRVARAQAWFHTLRSERGWVKATNEEVA